MFFLLLVAGNFLLPNLFKPVSNKWSILKLDPTQCVHGNEMLLDYRLIEISDILTILEIGK